MSVLLLVLLLPSGALARVVRTVDSRFPHSQPHCDGAHRNPIVHENCKHGSPPSEWDVNGAGDFSIQGFTTDISYNLRGEAVEFKVQTTSDKWRIDVYRLGATPTLLAETPLITSAPAARHVSFSADHTI